MNRAEQSARRRADYAAAVGRVAGLLMRLAELGGSQAVANELLASGALGDVAEGEHCPVAVWLRANGVRRPSVGEQTLSFEATIPDETQACGYFARMRLPRPVRAFIAEFDDGNHPELVRP